MTLERSEETTSHPDIEFWKSYSEKLSAHHAYDRNWESANCGVGLVCSTIAKPSRKIVDLGLSGLKALGHRGAVDADGKTGDGTGIMTQVPKEFFRQKIEGLGQTPTGPFAVGMVFLPRLDLSMQEFCRTIIESEILKFGYKLFGWRQVPIDVSIIGEKAQATRPEIEQIIVQGHEGESFEAFERKLFIIRRSIEKRAFQNALRELYICSLSSQHIVYKGMVLVQNLVDFYPDLQDPLFQSSFLIFHQRYSTNTFPKWSLAQPFRTLAHNGEINTLRGNINWMKVHERRMASDHFGEHSEIIKPIIQPDSSDSAALDAVFEVLVRAGRSAAMAKSMLIPESWKNNPEIPKSRRDFYSYCDSLVKPWDGPAAIVACDGNSIIAGMDRNGLRPLRYTLTNEDVLVVGSETGMVRFDSDKIIEKGKVGPGEMISVNLKQGGFFRDRELKNNLISEKPYELLTKNVRPFDEAVKNHRSSVTPEARYPENLITRQFLASYTRETIDKLLIPLGKTGKEAIGSMGDDTPLALLSDTQRGFHHFFRQNFAQVTNPPIDPIREARVMNLTTRFNNLVNVLDEECLVEEVLVLDSPLLMNSDLAAMIGYMDHRVKKIHPLFKVDEPGSLRKAIQTICKEAHLAINLGKDQIILTDEMHDTKQGCVPMILAVSALHNYLIEQGLRSKCSLNVSSNECFDVHSYAVLIGVGATTVNPRLAEETLKDLHDKKYFPNLSIEEVRGNFHAGMNLGLMKIMSKMGISLVSSYRGGCNFEVLGLSRSLVQEYFPNMSSRISGIGLSALKKRIQDRAKRAQEKTITLLDSGGLYSEKSDGEKHAISGDYIVQLQKSLEDRSFTQFKKATEILHSLPPMQLRDLFTFNENDENVNFEDVESITSIRKRFITPGMSLGALSLEAHGTLNIAMNRIGAKSCSGEGGEDPARYQRMSSGDSANSAIKQVASGRFGVTAAYLGQCQEIEIKIAQGAKPGEGGQLPGFKVTAEIAALRHSTEGVTLISPPPHHDIYSIEDLAQLIYDLKQINRHAKVCVKLVARSGIGTIAAGVAKANADVICVSGHSGGSGASPRSSISHAGLPWELGISEVHQLLVLNRLRDRVVLRVDGGIRCGRDVVIAALLGAEEFGIGTGSLVALGCLLVRQCHSNTCPVGICTQNKALRDKFHGTPEDVIRMFTFIAEEVREILAKIGYSDLDSIVGRTNLLRQVSRGDMLLDDIDLTPLLIQPNDQTQTKTKTSQKTRNEVPETLDRQIFLDAGPFFFNGEKMELAYNIENTYRSVGTRISSEIVKRFPDKKLAPGHLTVFLRGSAGQSLGAFAVEGLKIIVNGDANDYVGKGLSGGEIIVRPYASSPLKSHQNEIIGNTVLYGATAGSLFASGIAGQRFAVRNSGANAVVEGCGANGCEYMTGGQVVILGEVGENFAAGMTGGMAFVWDSNASLHKRINPESVVYNRLASQYWEDQLLGMIQKHCETTGSAYAESILENWEENRLLFYQICPKEMIDRLEHPIMDPPVQQNRKSSPKISEKIPQPTETPPPSP